MGVGGSCEGAKQCLWWAECRYSKLFEIQGMFRLRERWNTLQTCEEGWEESYKSGRTRFGKNYIKVWLFPRTSQLVKVSAPKRRSRCLITLLRHFILLTKHGSSSTVSLLLEDVVLHQHLHHSPPSRSQWKNSIRISRTAARCWFCDRAQEYSTSIPSWTALRRFSSPFRRWLQWYRSRQWEWVYRSRATSSLDT